MCRISSIVSVNKRRYKIFVNEEEPFVLYKGECAKFNLNEGGEITKELYEEICALLKKRAVIRAEYLLKDRDYTEKQLKDKLCGSGYPDGIAVYAVELMKEYGFVNDYKYAERFIADKSSRMSRRELEYRLSERCVPREIIKELLWDNQGYDGDDLEKQAFLNLYRKKNFDYGQLEQKGRRKLINYFIRKGFLYENIVTYLRETDKFNENGT